MAFKNIIFVTLLGYIATIANATAVPIAARGGTAVAEIRSEAKPALLPSKGMAVMIRQPDYSYAHNETMAEIHRARSSSDDLEKRHFAKVLACKDANCSDCHQIYDGSFNSFTCLSADNTACLIVSNLDEAQVNYWNHAGCNGNESTYHGCGNGPENINAPGTNSVGVQTYC